jgi:hypothetical protein
MELWAPVDPEVSAARMLRGAFLELQEAERLLAILEREAPNPARRGRLEVIRAALAQLEKLGLPPAGIPAETPRLVDT